MKNQIMQKSNEDIETKIKDRKKEQHTNFENTIDSLLKKTDEAKPKMSKETQAELDTLKGQFLAAKEEIEKLDKEIELTEKKEVYVIHF